DRVSVAPRSRWGGEHGFRAISSAGGLFLRASEKRSSPVAGGGGLRAHLEGSIGIPSRRWRGKSHCGAGRGGRRREERVWGDVGSAFGKPWSTRGGGRADRTSGKLEEVVSGWMWCSALLCALPFENSFVLFLPLPMRSTSSLVGKDFVKTKRTMSVELLPFALSVCAGALLVVLLSPRLRSKATDFIEVLLGKYVHETHRVRKEGEPPIVYGDKECGVNDELWDDPWGYIKKCRAKHGEIFTLRIANNSTPRGYEYQTFVMDPAVAYGTALGGRNVDKEPTSRQALQRFGCDRLLSTREGVFSLGRHLRHACIHGGYEELFESIQANVSKLGFPSLEGQSWPPSEGGARAVELDGKGEFVRSIERLAFRVMVESMYGDGVASDELDQYSPTKPRSDVVVPCRRSFCTWTQIADEFDLPRDEAYQLKKGMMWAALLNVQQVCVWTFLKVFDDSKVLNALRVELETARKAGGSKPNDPFTRSEVANSMPVLDMVIWETLRVYSRSNLIRVATTDHEISVHQATSALPKSYKVRAGDWVASFPRELHNEDLIFGKDAGRWNPLGRKSKSVKVRNKIMSNGMYAFGLGNGQCPAYKFGVDAVKIMLIHLVENYDISFDQEMKIPSQEISGVHAVPCPTGKVPFRFSTRLPIRKRGFRDSANGVLAAMKWQLLLSTKTRVSNQKKLSVLSCPNHYEEVVAEADYLATKAKGTTLIDPEGDIDIYYVMLKLPHDCLRMYLKKMVNYKVEGTPEAISKVQLWYPDFHAIVSAHISMSKDGLYFPWLKNVKIPKSDNLKQNHTVLVSGMTTILALTSEGPTKCEGEEKKDDYATELESQINGLASLMMKHLALEEEELPAACRSVAKKGSEMPFEAILRGCIDSLLASGGLEHNELFLSLLVLALEGGQWGVSSGSEALLSELDEKLPPGYRERAIQKLHTLDQSKVFV
ncbi:hypothetical protein ACHAWF_013921, partial [Thalassiosira exigua]